MAVIQEELRKGAQITDEIMVGRRPWKDLFTKHTFFTSGFKYYLTVISSSRTKKAQNAWSGFIESRVRLLVNRLEMHPSIALARPFNKGYDRVHRCKNNAQVEEVVSAGSLAYLYKPPAEEDGKLKNEVKTETKTEVKGEDGTLVKAEDGVPAKREKTEDAVSTVKGEPGDDAKVKLDDIQLKKEDETEMEIFTTNHYIGLQLAEKAKSLDLSREVNDWRAMCMSNEIYDADLMFLAVKDLKNTALPDDVFEPGEQRPQPPVKKGVKRTASEEPGARQHQPPAKRQVQGKQQQQQQQAAATATANSAAAAAAG